MSGGGGTGKAWIAILIGGVALVGLANGLHHAHAASNFVIATLFAIGGLSVVFGSCESMIVCVEALGERLRWNEFVAGTMAGLASNLPEVVMLVFVVTKAPRIAFVVVALTLHVGALVFGLYCCLLPRMKCGHARLPEPLVKLSTDLFACAGAVYLATGMLMLSLKTFDKSIGLRVGDLYAIGACLLLVEAVAIVRLVQRFSKATTPEEGAREEPHGELPSLGKVIGFGLLGTIASVVGGHAVGEFAGMLVAGLNERGYSEMFGAILLSIFSCAGVYLMILTAHLKGKYNIALSNASGAVTQVPFVVQPLILIMLAVFAQAGIIPTLSDGSVLPIDLDTVLVVLFGFPTMLILWKSIQDDGQVNWLETASMLGLFGLIIYFLAGH